MKVKELIKELEMLDTEMEVCISDSERGDRLVESVEPKEHDVQPHVVYALIKGCD
jgi:hypothetical protein